MRPYYSNPTHKGTTLSQPSHNVSSEAMQDTEAKSSACGFYWIWSANKGISIVKLGGYYARYGHLFIQVCFVYIWSEQIEN